MKLIHFVFSHALEVRDGGFKAVAHDNRVCPVHIHDAQFMRPAPEGYGSGPVRKTLNEAIADARALRDKLLAPYADAKLGKRQHSNRSWYEFYEPVTSAPNTQPPWE